MNDEPPASPVQWRDDGLPGSALYGDVYFSSDDGLAETRAVFLAGCDLPNAWAGRRVFTVAELGFGTGLNIIALLDLWRRERPKGARLRIFSVEAHPMGAPDAARALARWPELAEIAEILIDRWPGCARGVHRVDLPEFDAVLDLAVGEVEAALTQWDGRADAWFLDGFSPALNPAMWSESVLGLVGARSAPGARAATFTVAGAVRRGLTSAGFAVDKRPGFGRKRERLEAVFPGQAPAPSPAPGIAVIGAGIAGASLARALRALGLDVSIHDPRGVGGGASGNAAALVTPRLDAGLGAAARLSAETFRRAVALYRAHPEAILARGSRQLEAGERDNRRFATIAGSDLFEPGSLEVLSEARMSEDLGEAARSGLRMTEALVVEPAPILEALCGTVDRRNVARLEHTGEGWRLIDGEEGVIATVGQVVLAGGHANVALAPSLSLRPVRGQTSLASGRNVPSPTAFGGYVIPTREGLLFGATHDRDETGEEVRLEDHQRNLALLAKGLPKLAGDLDGAALTGRACIRAASPDHLPLAGAVPGMDGVWVLSGLGGRGFCLAPLLAEHLAAQIAGVASPLQRDLAALVEPERFANRRLHKAPIEA